MACAPAPHSSSGSSGARGGEALAELCDWAAAQMTAASMSGTQRQPSLSLGGSRFAAAVGFPGAGEQGTHTSGGAIPGATGSAEALLWAPQRGEGVGIDGVDEDGTESERASAELSAWPAAKRLRISGGVDGVGVDEGDVLPVQEHSVSDAEALLAWLATQLTTADCTQGGRRYMLHHVRWQHYICARRSNKSG